MSMKSFALATATTVLLSGIAVAQVPGDDDRDDMGERNTMDERSTMDKSSRKFDKLDTDRDGQVTAEEARQGGITRFRDYDTNNDGIITKFEYESKKEQKHQ